MSPTARALIELRKLGYCVQVVERWNAFARCRQDLFGVVDVIALGANEVLGIQVTSRSNHSTRVKKVLEADGTKYWLKAGAKLEVWSWERCKGWRKTCIVRDESEGFKVKEDHD